jgi:hypothetical protein
VSYDPSFEITKTDTDSCLDQAKLMLLVGVVVELEAVEVEVAEVVAIVTVTVLIGILTTGRSAGRMTAPMGSETIAKVVDVVEVVS